MHYLSLPTSTKPATRYNRAYVGLGRLEEAWVDIEWCVRDYPGEGSFVGLKKELGRHMEIQRLEGILHVGSGSGSGGDEGSCTMVEGGCTKIAEGSSPV